jgi:leucine dehydrogenase
MLQVIPLKIEGFETVVVGRDVSSKLTAIIAVHSTKLGPSLGGIRMWPYTNEKEALQDVLRLAAAMTKKAAISGLQMGGGKAIIIGDPGTDKTQSLFRSMGEFIDALQGKYIAAKDSGILPDDLDIVAEKTRHVTGTTEKHGGSGDPSLATAKGILVGMQAACKFVLGTNTLKDRVVAIQGVGQVGWNLGNLLTQQGAKLFVADLDPSRVTRVERSWKATGVPLSEIHQIQADIFAPCALGGILNADTIPHLRAKIVAGGANNQFWDEEQDPYRLMKRNILHVPDYILNAGGLIHLYVHEILHQRQLAPWISKLGLTVHQVLSASVQQQLPPLIMAHQMALKRLELS